VLTTQHPLFAKVGTTSPTSGGRSVGIVRSRTKAREFSFFRSVALKHHSSLSYTQQNGSKSDLTSWLLNEDDDGKNHFILVH
jgi:hypothetical protein